MTTDFSAVFPRRSPLDGSDLSPISATDPAVLGDLVARARTAQRAWAEVPLEERVATVHRAKGRLLGRAEEIAELLRRECGKTIEEAVLGEVVSNADVFDYWAEHIEALLEPSRVELDPLSYPGKSGQILRDPRGVIALITPWNYPITIPVRALVPALLAGNAVVFKPSEISPRAGAVVASIFEGLLPDGLLQLVQGGGEVGAALLDCDIDLCVFTGSVATGRRIAVRCAERFIPTSLELGGKDAAIVLADCPLERTARGLVWGAFKNAGQSCSSIERVYVEKGVAEALIARVVELTKELRPGVDTGVVTTERQCEIVREHVEAAVKSGAQILTGEVPARGSLDFPPTVLRVTDEDTPLMREETFGPVLPIVVVSDADEAIARTNASRFALSTSIWTRRTRAGAALARRLRSGVVTINNHGFTSALPQAPWTGTGDSGHGITNSPHALNDLTRVRFVLEDRNRAKRELWWYPYSPALRAMAFAMARLRGGDGILGRVRAALRLASLVPKRLLGR